MTTKSGSSTISTTRLGSGQYQATPVQLGGAAHVTVSFDDTVIMTRDQLLAAVHTIVDSMLSK
jgi:hypothetical protein